ncbi:MAG: hypothetical protein AAF288_04605 [Planctomycetota bacterium]
MFTRSKFYAGLMTLAAALFAGGVEADRAEVMDRLVTPDAVVVGWVDVERTNFQNLAADFGPALDRVIESAPEGEAGESFRSAIGELRRGLEQGVVRAEAARKTFVEMGLGQVVYAYDAVDLPLPGPGIPSLGLIAVLPRPGVSPESLRPLIPLPREVFGEDGPAVVDGVLVYGRGFTVERALREDNAPRQDLIDSVEAMIGPDTVAAGVISPTDDHRRAFRSALPELYTADPASEPERMMRTVFEGLRWVGVAVDGGDAPRVRVRVEAASPESAEELLDTMRRGLAMLEARAQAEAGPDREMALGFLEIVTVQGLAQFEVDGSSLRLEVDAADAAQSLLSALGPSLVQARESAQQAVEMSSARQLLIALIVWADQNAAQRDDRRNVFPQELGVLIESQHVTPAALTSPFSATPDGFDAWGVERQSSWLAANPVWVYLTPGLVMEEVGSPSQHMVLFRRPSVAPHFATAPVGFADGHVESVELERLDALLKEQTDKGLAEWDPQE